MAVAEEQIMVVAAVLVVIAVTLLVDHPQLVLVDNQEPLNLLMKYLLIPNIQYMLVLVVEVVIKINLMQHLQILIGQEEVATTQNFLI